MKEFLTLSGRIELSRQEVTIALKEWVEKTRKLDVTKTVYLGEFKGAVMEVSQVSGDSTIPEFKAPEPKELRKNKGGFKRQNTGIFAFLKEYFDDLRKQKKAQVSLEVVFKDVKDLFPKMTERRLKLYLYDKRILRGVQFESGKKIIKL